MTLDPRAQSLAANPHLKPVWLAVHRRLEESGGDLGVACRVRDLTADERRELDLMLGTRTKASNPQLQLESLDARLRERAGCTLHELVRSVCGPLRNRPAERQNQARERDQLWDAAAAHPAATDHSQLADWFTSLQRTGRLTRLDRPGDTLQAALDVVSTVTSPDHARIGRAMLAASIVGDAHALDNDSPVGKLAIAALAHLAGMPSASAAQVRAVWGRFGVTGDETSSNVLTAGLNPEPTGPLTAAAQLWATGGVALHLPLAAIRAERWRLPARTLVHMCENPAVLDAALTRFGGDCPPMICVEGNPTLAAMELCRHLVHGGAALAYHGDFGTGGIQIANLVVSRLDAQPWQMSHSDWLAAYTEARKRKVTLPALRGTVPTAVWDPQLADEINRAGVEIEEEQVIAGLLADLLRS